MSAGRVFNSRKHTPSVDTSKATIPTARRGGVHSAQHMKETSDSALPIHTFPIEYTVLAARVIRRKATTDAERIVFAQMLGLVEA